MQSVYLKWRSHLINFIFCALLYGFALLTLLKSPTEFSETENRILAQRPKVTARSLLGGTYETDYEEYLTDQFFWRDGWVGLKTSVERALLKQESKDVYFAKDGYLIEKHTGSFTTDMAQRNLAFLAEFTRQYEARFGPGHLSVLLIPNAVDILQDKLPPFAGPGSGEAYCRQAAGLFPEGVWFDAAPLLRAHMQEELYYRTDHHWKTLAAFYVCQAWLSWQGFPAPGLADYTIQTVTDCFEGTIQSRLGIPTAGDEIELFLPQNGVSCTVQKGDSQEESIYSYAALDTKDKYAVFLGGNAPFIQIRTDAGGGRRLLVIKDSYANCFVPFLLNDFERIDLIDLRYTNQRLSEQIAEGGYTDLLILYNVSGFAEDMSVAKLMN